MTGLPITLTFAFDDMAQAERAIAAVRWAITDTPVTASRRLDGFGSVQDGRKMSTNGLSAGVAEQQNDTVHVSVTDETAGETAPHSKMDGDAIAAVKGQARPASVADAEPSPSFILNPFIAIRPNCQKPDHCSGYGRNHCHACKVKAAAEVEAA